MSEGVFEKITKQAIGDIISKYGSQSKYGLIISKEEEQELIGDLYQLILNSRQLKSSGDRFLASLSSSSKTDTKELR